MKRWIPSRFSILQILPQKLNFQPYSTSCNIILLVMNYNIKLSMFDISELLYLLNYQNWQNNWPELVLFLASEHLVEFPL